jgi:hypothetical protein
MIPHPIPIEPGCLDILKHRGSYPTQAKGTFTTESGIVIPIAGSIGTNDPDVWTIVLWLEGKAYTREMFCDVIGHVNPPAFRLECALQNFANYPDQWSPVMAATP